VTRPQPPEPRHETALRRYEHIWVALLERPWKSLAVVPATPGLHASAVARGVAQVGSDYLGTGVLFVSAEGARLGGSRKLLDSLVECAPFSTMISTDPPLESEAALLLARNVDAVLLLVPLGRARLGDVRQALEQIGRQRVLGAVSVASDDAA
jgi:hypothetical protein